METKLKNSLEKYLYVDKYYRYTEEKLLLPNIHFKILVKTSLKKYVYELCFTSILYNVEFGILAVFIPWTLPILLASTSCLLVGRSK